MCNILYNTFCDSPKASPIHRTVSFFFSIKITKEKIKKIKIKIFPHLFTNAKTKTEKTCLLFLHAQTL